MSRADYQNWYQKSPEWARWFQTVIIDAPGRAMTVEILQELRARYEAHHRVQITDDVLEAAVELSCLFLPDQNLPLKAINLIDEASARNRLRALASLPDLRELDEQIERLDIEKEAAVASQEFPRAAAARDQVNNLKNTKERLLRESIERQLGIHGRVDGDAIAEVISRTLGIPLEDVKNRDTASLPRETKLLRTDLPRFERHQAESVLPGQVVEIQQGTGLVLLPHRDEFNALYESVIRPAMSIHGVVANKADNLYEPGAILGQVWSQIRTAEVIVADVSGIDPNVIYGLGLCFGLHRCPLLLVRDPAELPFNLRSLRYIPYENSVRGAEKLKSDLTRAIQEFLSASRASRAET